MNWASDARRQPFALLFATTSRAAAPSHPGRPARMNPARTERSSEFHTANRTGIWGLFGRRPHRDLRGRSTFARQRPDHGGTPPPPFGAPQSSRSPAAGRTGRPRAPARTMRRIRPHPSALFAAHGRVLALLISGRASTLRAARSGLCRGRTASWASAPASRMPAPADKESAASRAVADAGMVATVFYILAGGLTNRTPSVTCSEWSDCAISSFCSPWPVRSGSAALGMTDTRKVQGWLDIFGTGTPRWPSSWVARFPAHGRRLAADTGPQAPDGRRLSAAA